MSEESRFEKAKRMAAATSDGEHGESDGVEYTFEDKRFHPSHFASGDPARDAWLAQLVVEGICPRCATDTLDADPDRWHWSRVTTHRCLPMCHSCMIEEEHEWAGGGLRALRVTPAWPMGVQDVALRDELVARWRSGIRVVTNPSDDYLELHLFGTAPRVVFTHGSMDAVWREGMLTGDDMLVHRLRGIEEKADPVRVAEPGLVVVPELQTHLGAWACGVAAGFELSGDYPPELEVPPGAIP